MENYHASWRHPLSIILLRTSFIDGFTDDVDNATKRCWADGNGDWATGVSAWLTPNQPFRSVHGDCSDNILAQMLRNLE